MRTQEPSRFARLAKSATDSGAFLGGFPSFIVGAKGAPLHPDIRWRRTDGFGRGPNSYGELVAAGWAAAVLVERLSSESFLDPHREVRRRLGAAFAPDHHLERTGEFGPVQARFALREVPSEVRGPIRIELAVKEMLDLDQDFVATNL